MYKRQDVLQGVGPGGFIHGQHVRDQEAAACEEQPAGDDAGQQSQHGGLVQPVPVSYTHLPWDIAFTIDRNVYRGRDSLSISIQEIRSHREM